MAELNLQDYERKRDFRRTPEPRGAPSGAGCSPRFVIQMLAATLGEDVGVTAGGDEALMAKAPSRVRGGAFVVGLTA